MDKSTSSGPEEVSLYNSALDGSTFFLINGNDSVNNSQNHGAELNESKVHHDNARNKNKNLLNNLLESEEGSDNLEVDPKSNLANKTIFKTDNPNLSIIEINNDSSARSDSESVYLICSDDEEEHKEKVRSMLHSSRQKSNVTGSSSTLASTPSTASLSTVYTSPSTSSVPSISTSTLSFSTAASTTTSDKITKISPEKRLIHIYDNIDEFENNLPQTVKILTTPYGSKVYLVGTAHFSEESQDDVSFVIRNVKPDIVMVELCTSRINILKLDEKSLLEEAKNFNLTKIRDIIKTNGFINGIFFILLLHMSAQLAKDIGMAPGGEFRRAFDEVQKLPHRCTLHLGDRPINITLQRALRALSLWQTIKLVWRLASTESINAEEIEECKQQDLLEKLLQEMAGEFPAFSDVLVAERDLYLCNSLQLATQPIIFSNGQQRPVNVVGVVGIGHTAGIINNWLKVRPDKINEILEIPPSSLSTRIFKFTIKFGFYGLITYGIVKILRPKFHKLAI